VTLSTATTNLAYKHTNIHGSILHQLLLYRSSSTPIQLQPSVQPLVSHHHHHTQTLHQAGHLQSHWHWAVVASPTMCHLTSAPTTEAPHAFHHQLEHCHCLFLTPLSAEQRLPHLNNSSYRATPASSHRSLLNQARSSSDGPFNSRTSLSFTRL
jgi:hypothetical protein